MDIRLLQQASDLGHAEAQYALGTAYLMGDGVPQDATKAVALFERSAAQGDARAQCNLGAMYAQGIGVKHDYQEARRWYALSAEQGNPDGQYNLAVVCAQGLGGCQKDLNKARELLALAAAQGQEKAKALLQSLLPEEGEAAALHVSPGPPASAKVGPQARPELTPEGSAAPRHAAPEEAFRVQLPTPVVNLGRQFRKVTFGPTRPVELPSSSGAGASTGVAWRGEEAEARFPKPGSEANFRRLFLLKGLVTEDEVASILHIARTSLDFNVDNDSVDQRPTFERYVMQMGQYIHPEMEQVLRPIVEDRLVPYVRLRFAAPEAVVCTALVRRYLPDERRVHPTHLDGHAFCTAVLGLNAGEFRGGLYVQPHPCAVHREFVELGRGELAVHQYDLPHGVHVFDGRRYSLIFWVKDCIRSCVTNATSWYDAAAAAGDADAMAALAQKLRRGMNKEGVGSDPEQAFALYLRAAEMGQVDAMTNLGAMYETGCRGVPANPKEALDWWRRAAEAGDHAAQRMLALAYAGGSCGLKSDPLQACRWMSLAAEQEDCEAMYWLSAFHGQGAPGVPADADKALFWLRGAAQMGHPEAQYNLGALHLSGQVVEQSLDLAALWFHRSALNGNPAAQCNIGAFYAQGLGGLPLDLKEALRWYEASAERGNPDGQHNLALMYAQGLGGVEQDFAEARRWCEKAALQGQAKAVAMLEALALPSESPLSTCEEVAPGATTALLAAKVDQAKALLEDIRGCQAASPVGEPARRLLDSLLARIADLSAQLRDVDGSRVQLAR